MGPPNSSGDRDTLESSQNPPQSPSANNCHEGNPFVAFRRYADEQISSFLHAMVGLPSGLVTSSDRDWSVFRDVELNDALPRWQHNQQDEYSGANGAGGSGDGSVSQGRNGRNNNAGRSYPPDQMNETGSASHRCHRHASHVFPSSAFDSVFDNHSPLSLGPPSFFRDFSHFHASFIHDFLAPSVSAGWPVPYLLFSPYSPLHLEHQQQLRRHKASDHSLIGLFAPLVSSSSSSSADYRDIKEPRWRDAFEDLLRLENDKEMLDRNRTYPRKEESGKDWLSGMISRGSLGDGWSHVRSANGEQGDYFRFVSDKRPEGETRERNGGPGSDFTELDLYDTFLRQVNGDFDEENGKSSPASPLLKAILDERQRHAQELEQLRNQWKDIRNSRHAFRREQSNEGLFGDEPEADVQHEAGGPGGLVNMQGQDVTPSEPSSESPSTSVVSTMTQTERRTLSDGSIRTKTIVNKRFADGREENSESEEVTGNSSSSSSNNNQVIPDSADSNGTQDAPKKGWFWKG